MVVQKEQKIAFKQVTTENVFAQAKAQAKKLDAEKQTVPARKAAEVARPFAVYEDTKENGHVAAKKEVQEKR
jgi:hypothetical protein